jgi:hypothetical protein
VSPREALIEAAVTAWRPRDASGAVRAHAAWADLDEAGRQDVYAATDRSRALEAALDPDGLSTTGRRVLGRIGREPR